MRISFEGMTHSDYFDNSCRGGVHVAWYDLRLPVQLYLQIVSFTEQFLHSRLEPLHMLKVTLTSETVAKLGLKKLNPSG